MQGRFGLYVHWPFCAAKCPYCDFNSHVRGGIDHDRWSAALRQELSRVALEVPDAVLDTIFFGGGTPSLMPPALVGALIDDATTLWRTSNDVEITLEANPTSIEADKFRGFQAAGVNRVSIGVQAFNDIDLRKLGRVHSAEEALVALDVAREQFDRVSIDLIYARQDQSLDDWRAELERAVGLGLDHLSLYQLTIEPGTVFAKRHRAGSLKGLPQEDVAVDMWDATQEICEAAGMPSYETSNHAVPGAESRHNLIYWTGGDWAGIGPGAHGRLSVGAERVATETALAPEAWLERVDRLGSGETVRDTLSRDEVIEEAVLMGLRLRDGIPMAQLEHLGWEAPGDKVARLTELGLLEDQRDRLQTTPAGRPLLNSIITELLV
ncbi:MAG: radical SAM family heme chaperone HemW [Pseudomonadota bacterium]